MYIYIFIGIIISLILLFWIRRNNEHFINLDKIVKPDISITGCKALLPDFTPIQSQVIAKSFIDTGRIKTYKPENSSASDYCYINYDIQNKEKDIIMSEHQCSLNDPLFISPFISDVFTANAPQTTISFQPNVCVFKIDKNKINSQNIHSFWKSNVGLNECHDANAYILELLDHLTNEFKFRSNLLFSQRMSNFSLQSNIINLGIKINNLNSNINFKTNVYNKLSSSNYTLEGLKSDSHIYKGNLDNFLSDFEKKSNSNIHFFLNLEHSCNVAFSNISQQCDLYFAKKTEQFTSNNTLKIEYTNINRLYEDKSTIKSILETKHNIYTRDLSNLTVSNKICGQNLDNIGIINFNCNLKKNQIDDENNILINLNSDLSSKVNWCIAEIENLNLENNNLNTNITKYTTNISECITSNINCKKDVATNLENIKNLEKYYEWVRAWFDRLQCSNLSKRLVDMEQSYTELKTSCDNANKTLQSNLDFTDMNKVTSESMTSCSDEVKDIRDKMMKKIFPEIVFVPKHFITCPASSNCPIFNANMANLAGQDICDDFKAGSKFTGKWANLNGQRGGVYCTYYGDASNADDARKANLIALQAGALLPDVVPSGCTMDASTPYTMNCLGGKKFNFEYCGKGAKDVGSTIVCGDKILNIGICGNNSKCDFGQGRLTISRLEMDNLCKKYFPSKPEVKATGKTISLNDGRQGVYCTYTGSDAEFNAAYDNVKKYSSTAYNFL